MDRMLNATGLKCPKPLFEVSRELKELEPGGVLEVRADDPAFKLDIEAWCRRTGNELLELRRDQATFTALVRRAGLPGEGQCLATS
jgi:TusA-related sulfurtransferase